MCIEAIVYTYNIVVYSDNVYLIPFWTITNHFSEFKTVSSKINIKNIFQISGFKKTKMFPRSLDTVYTHTSLVEIEIAGQLKRQTVHQTQK